MKWLPAVDLSWMDALRPVLAWPAWKKAVVLAAGFILPLLAYVALDLLPLQNDLEQVQKRIVQQQRIYRKNLMLTRHLPQKQKEFARLQQQLRVALAMLPKRLQIPSLIEEISRAGRDAGLDFTVFKPAPEVHRQFYSIFPVDFVLTGTFRQLLTFLKRVGEIPRIVDIRNLGIRRQEHGRLLEVHGQAVTYRLLEKVGDHRPRGGRRR